MTLTRRHIYIFAWSDHQIVKRLLTCYTYEYSTSTPYPTYFVTAQTVALIDNVTRRDAALYTAGLARVLADVAAVERDSRTRILCPAEVARLARKAAHLLAVRPLLQRLRTTR